MEFGCPVIGCEQRFQQLDSLASHLIADCLPKETLSAKYIHLEGLPDEAMSRFAVVSSGCACRRVHVLAQKWRSWVVLEDDGELSALTKHSIGGKVWRWFDAERSDDGDGDDELEDGAWTPPVLFSQFPIRTVRVASSHTQTRADATEPPAKRTRLEASSSTPLGHILLTHVRAVGKPWKTHVTERIPIAALHETSRGYRLENDAMGGSISKLHEGHNWVWADS
eukprot:TRINITY_DN17728_c0_g1_i1.p1 TRINITY_DN17728_c0_g1~~TRINITY_DN17728_c0_g1_i1.p1  ORF type:complete len:243 (-),score=21.01 TRINITY_DN17728_c0_g1_i1:390-1061(-)